MVVKFYISMLSGNKEMKKRQMKAQLIMESKGVEFKVIDIADPSSEQERVFMQRNAPAKNGARNPVPPQFFNDDQYCGDYEGFDDANESDSLEEFLKLPRGSLPQVPIILHNLSNYSSRDVSLEKEVVNSQLNGTNPNAQTNGGDGNLEEETVNGYRHSPVDDGELQEEANHPPRKGFEWGDDGETEQRTSSDAREIEDEQSVDRRPQGLEDSEVENVRYDERRIPLAKTDVEHARDSERHLLPFESKLEDAREADRAFLPEDSEIEDDREADPHPLPGASEIEDDREADSYSLPGESEVENTFKVEQRSSPGEPETENARKSDQRSAPVEPARESAHRGERRRDLETTGKEYVDDSEERQLLKNSEADDSHHVDRPSASEETMAEYARDSAQRPVSGEWETDDAREADGHPPAVTTKKYVCDQEQHPSEDASAMEDVGESKQRPQKKSADASAMEDAGDNKSRPQKKSAETDAEKIEPRPPSTQEEGDIGAQVFDGDASDQQRVSGRGEGNGRVVTPSDAAGKPDEEEEEDEDEEEEEEEEDEDVALPQEDGEA